MGNCQLSATPGGRTRRDMSCFGENPCVIRPTPGRRTSEKRTESYFNRQYQVSNQQVSVMDFNQFSLLIKGICPFIISYNDQKWLDILNIIYLCIHDPLPLPTKINLGELVHFMETKIDERSYINI